MSMSTAEEIFCAEYVTFQSSSLCIFLSLLAATYHYSNYLLLIHPSYTRRYPLGYVFVDFIFNPQIRRLTGPDSVHHFLSQPLCWQLVRWLDSGEEFSNESQSIFKRLTSRAFAMVVSKSSSKNQTLALWNMLISVKVGWPIINLVNLDLC